MEVFNSRNNLLEELACFAFLEALMLYDVVKQFTPWNILSNEVQLPWRLYDLIQLNNIWMSGQLQYFYFSGNPLYINIFHYLVFLEDLNSHFFACEIVRSQLDFAKGSFSNSLSDEVVPNTFRLVLSLFTTFVSWLRMMPILLGRIIRLIFNISRLIFFKIMILSLLSGHF